MVPSVEKLRAELHHDALLHRRVLQERNVGRIRSGTMEKSAIGIAWDSDLFGSERRNIEILVVGVISRIISCDRTSAVIRKIDPI